VSCFDHSPINILMAELEIAYLAGGWSALLGPRSHRRTLFWGNGPIARRLAFDIFKTASGSSD
jgi:hypothetical protein